MATIYLYDEIGPGYYGMLDGKWMADELAKANGEQVDLRINSPGGSVTEAQAMYTLLARYSGGVTAHIDSLAASAATIVAMAAPKIKIAENAFMMIHPAWTIASGDASQLRNIADTLDKVDTGILDQYVARTGNTREQIKAWVDAETWMTAQEAVARKFADEIGQPLAVKACVREGQFAKTPSQLLSPAASVSPRIQAAAIERRLKFARACT